jgi:tetratricopeptide (TPR) repeat protein
MTQALWRGVQAAVLARRGGLAEAERMARQAVSLAERTDFLNQRGAALVVLGQVLRKQDRQDAAQGVLAEALSLYEQKGNVVGAAQVRAALAPSTPV